jgi:hypothetical protein
MLHGEFKMFSILSELRRHLCSCADAERRTTQCHGEFRAQRHEIGWVYLTLLTPVAERSHRLLQLGTDTSILGSQSLVTLQQVDVSRDCNGMAVIGRGNLFEIACSFLRTATIPLHGLVVACCAFAWKLICFRCTVGNLGRHPLSVHL